MERKRTVIAGRPLLRTPGGSFVSIVDLALTYFSGNGGPKFRKKFENLSKYRLSVCRPADLYFASPEIAAECTSAEQAACLCFATKPPRSTPTRSRNYAAVRISRASARSRGVDRRAFRAGGIVRRRSLRPGSSTGPALRTRASYDVDILAMTRKSTLPGPHPSRRPFGVAFCSLAVGRRRRPKAAWTRWQCFNVSTLQ